MDDIFELFLRYTNASDDVKQKIEQILNSEDSENIPVAITITGTESHHVSFQEDL